jgi:hypothetical protein
LVLQREAERAAEDAAEIRKRFLQVQGQANTSQAVAMETKRELEKLRSEAEQAEMDAAQAASIQEQQSKAEGRRAEEEAKGAQQTNGYSQYGMQQQQQPPQQQYGGYGQEQASMPPAPSYGFGQMGGNDADQSQNMYGGGLQNNGSGDASNNSSYGFGQMGLNDADQSQNMYGGGLQNSGSGEGGFAAGVMGQSGGDKFALPSPHQFNTEQQQQQQHTDPYANPF